MARYDFAVLGGGPAGRRAAIQAAKLGRSVVIIDDRSRIGGVSVHTGTIPSKTLREAVMNLTGWRERGIYGASYRAKNEIGAADLAARLGKTLDHEIAVLEHQLVRNGVKTLTGQARFTSPQSIVVRCEDPGRLSDITIEAEKFLIAVGTIPYRPETIPFNACNVLDSDDFIRSPSVPRSLTVIGGGVIGLEYATIFSALDVPVAIVEPKPGLLDFIDREIVDNFMYQLRDRGVNLRLGACLEKIAFDCKGNPVCHLTDGRRIPSDMVLFTAGRVGATADLDLQQCGITADERGRLMVDPLTFQTEIPHIYAAGDVIGFPSLASISMEQGRAAACHAFGEALPSPNQAFPLGIYSVPEISSVGMTEEAARNQGIAYECGVARLKETSRGHIMGINAGVLKMIFTIPDRRLIGVHIIGEGATELIHIGQAVINLGGGLDYFVENSFNYPTLAEAYKVAALDAWNRLRVRTDSGSPR